MEAHRGDNDAPFRCSKLDDSDVIADRVSLVFIFSNSKLITNLSDADVPIKIQNIGGIFDTDLDGDIQCFGKVNHQVHLNT